MRIKRGEFSTLQAPGKVLSVLWDHVPHPGNGFQGCRGGALGGKEFLAPR